LDTVIKIQNHKIHRSSDCSKFLKPVFSNSDPLKNRYISKTYSEGPHERPEAIHWHRKRLALTFCVLCLSLVLRRILYTGWIHPGG